MKSTAAAGKKDNVARVAMIVVSSMRPLPWKEGDDGTRLFENGGFNAFVVRAWPFRGGYNGDHLPIRAFQGSYRASPGVAKEDPGPCWTATTAELGARKTWGFGGICQVPLGLGEQVARTSPWTNCHPMNKFADFFPLIQCNAYSLELLLSSPPKEVAR